MVEFHSRIRLSLLVAALVATATVSMVVDRQALRGGGRELPAWAGPKIQSWHTANGARVLFVHAPELPMLDLRVVFKAGSSRDIKAGVAGLTNAMLDQGAGPWNADQIAERMEGVGAELGNGARRDMAWVSARTLTRQPALGTTLGDAGYNISDPVAHLNFLFAGGGLPDCYVVANSDPVELTSSGVAILDFNGDGGSNIADAVASLNFLFGGGAPPALGEGCAEVQGDCVSNCE